MTASPGRWRAALAGAVAAGVALAVTEVISGFGGAGAPSVVSSVGNRLVDALAGGLKDLAVSLFGTGDKAALLTGIVVTSLAVGAVAGLLERRWSWSGAAVFAGFAAVGIVAVAADALASPGLLGAACVLGAAAGIGVLRVLVGRTPLLPSTPDAPGATGEGAEDPRVRAPTRRALLAAAGAAGAGAAVLAMAGRGLRDLGTGGPATATRPLPAPRTTVAVPPDSAVAADGLTPYVVPTPDFYRIDTALIVPRVDASTWRLSVTGLVDRPLTLGYDDLLDLDLVEVPVTISCVSNEVGGDLVGNAVWRGVPLAGLLEQVGVRAGAEQVFARSVDGFTAGFPLAAARDGRTALVAVGMNGEALPARHGFPARLIVAGLYGYVSAVKWLQEIRLSPWEGVDGYWIPRGWAKEGPIKTQSRIDVPRPGAALAAGRQPIAGVAWAPTRGIEAVEVAVDDGGWRRARLGPVASDETWVQWVVDDWYALPGRHRLVVRAVDGTGAVQDATVRPPDPDGATGYHAVNVSVR